MKAFPSSATISVSAHVAEHLLQAATQLPWRSNPDYYNVDYQTEAYLHLKEIGAEEFNGLVTQIKDCLARPPFSALVKGLQFDDGHRLFVALNRAFGTLVATPYDPHSPRHQLIHHIQPATDLAIASDLHQQTERLHTDCADWPTPNHYISMQCVRPDRNGGGRSRQIDLYEVQAALADHADPNLLERLHQETVPWQLADYLGGGIVWQPILTPNHLRWRRYTIDFALAHDGIELSQAMMDTLDIVDEVLTHTERVIDFALEAGDFLILDNHRCLHARTPIANPETQRLMLRAWVQT